MIWEFNKMQIKSWVMDWKALKPTIVTPVSKTDKTEAMSWTSTFESHWCHKLWEMITYIIVSMTVKNTGNL